MGVDSQGGAEAASLVAEAKLLARIAAPAVIMQFFMLMTRSVTAMCVGSWLGPVALTGYSLGNLAGSLCTLSIMMGILSAMDTLAPQAMGAKRYQEVGLLAQRAAAVCLLLFLPLSALWFNAEEILLYLNQPPASAAYTGRLLRVTVFSMPGTIIFEVQKRFLTSQSVVWPLAGVAVVVAALQPLFLLLFVQYLGLGFDGVGLALCASQWACPLITWLYIRCFSPHNPATWTGFDLKAIEVGGMVEFLRLGLPGILTMSEWWFWEVTCFTAGMIGAQALAAHTVVYNLIPIMFMLSFGFSMGVSIRRVQCTTHLGLLICIRTPMFVCKLTLLRACDCAVLLAHRALAAQGGASTSRAEDSDSKDGCESRNGGGSLHSLRGRCVGLHRRSTRLLDRSVHACGNAGGCRDGDSGWYARRYPYHLAAGDALLDRRWVLRTQRGADACPRPPRFVA